ncbi:MAG: helix-turn-helix domain-containing protein [Pseudomonadota bacterium]
MSEALSVHHGSFGRAALYQLDRPIITHAHREGHLIFYVSGSRAVVSVGDESFNADETAAVAISPWEPHSFSLREDEGPCTCLVLYIKPMWFLENSRSAEFALSFGSPAIRMTPSVQRWVTRLTSLLLEDDRLALFDGYLYETTRHCFDQSWRQTDLDLPQCALRSRFSDFRVRRSMRLLQENIAEDVSMCSLAREVGLSRPHFFKLFKKQMGITPNLYLNTLRAEHAIDDLTSTMKSVTEIGYDLGFSSQASFTRFFASNVGIPPSDYRRVAAVM